MKGQRKLFQAPTKIATAARIGRDSISTIDQNTRSLFAPSTRAASSSSGTQATGATPHSASTPLINPSFGLYSQVQNSTTTVEASRYGMKKDSLHSHRPGSPRFTSSAKASDTTTSGTVQRRDEGPAGERLTPASRLLVVAGGNS